MKYLYLTGILLLLISCSQEKKDCDACQDQNDPLSLWSDADPKKQIMAFVKDVTDPKSANFVPVEKRLATFDFDGTIGCEKPTYMEVLVAMTELCHQYKSGNYDTSNEQLYIAACTDDYKYINENAYEAILTAFKGRAQAVYEDSVGAIVPVRKNSKLDRTLSQMYYAPMLQLLDYLKANEFDIYIVSGSELGFLRKYGSDYLNIPARKMIGSAVELTYEYDSKENNASFVRDSAYMSPMAANSGKAELIENHIGIQPILAFGNTMGDFEMLQYAGANSYKNLSLILVHDDPEEYVYFDEELDSAATANKWVSVGMKENFGVIFPE